jgi:hypothetical protein
MKKIVLIVCLLGVIVFSGCLEREYSVRFRYPDYSEASLRNSREEKLRVKLDNYVDKINEGDIENAFVPLFNFESAYALLEGKLDDSEIFWSKKIESRKIKREKDCLEGKGISSVSEYEELVLSEWISVTSKSLSENPGAKIKVLYVNVWPDVIDGNVSPPQHAYVSFFSSASDYIPSYVLQFIFYQDDWWMSPAHIFHSCN